MVRSFSVFRNREGRQIFVTREEFCQAAEKLLTDIEMKLKQLFEEGAIDLKDKQLVIHELGSDLMFSMRQEQIRRLSFFRDAYGLKKRHTKHIHGEDFRIEDAT